jgi:hypothetical protein
MRRSGATWPRLALQLRHPEFLGAPVYSTWLCMAPNLGRISRSTEGWGPTIDVHAPIAEGAESTRKVLAAALRRTRLPIRAVLERWLGNDGRFDPELETRVSPMRGSDYVRIEWDSAAAALESVRRALVDLTEEIEIDSMSDDTAQ